MALASGMQPRDLTRLFLDRSGEIFRPRPLHAIRPGAKYDAEGLRRVMRDVFGERELRDLPRRVLVSSYDCVEADAKFWHNWGEHADSGARCVDVAMRTSAAPTFFPPAEGRYIDGGVAANDPVMCAVAKALKEGVPPRAIRVLSLGTGRAKNRGFRPGDWGALQWLVHLIGVLLGAPMSVARYQATWMPEVDYHEVDVELDEDIPLDDAGRVPELVERAYSTDLREAIAWVRKGMERAA